MAMIIICVAMFNKGKRRAIWRDVYCTPPEWGRYINFDRTVKITTLKYVKLPLNMVSELGGVTSSYRAVMIPPL